MQPAFDSKDESDYNSNGNNAKGQRIGAYQGIQQQNLMKLVALS